MPGACFSTLDNQPVPSVSVAQMREIDRIAIEETGPTLFEMMSMAGRNLHVFLTRQWPRGIRIGPIIVLTGSGHNGGGGICCANHLLEQGADVRLCLSTSENQLADATAEQLRQYQQRNGNVVSIDELEGVTPFLIVDALIGYGLTGTPVGNVADLVLWANAQSAPTISLDVPTGLYLDSCMPSAVCIKAEKTVTLALPKRGLGCKEVGELWLSDIGIGADTYGCMGLSYISPFAGEPLIRLQHKRPDSPHLPGIPL